MTLLLAQLPPIAINLLVIGFLLVCLIMILTVLIQKPQGGGLSGAFGSGAGSGQTAFGARTGDALTVATIGIFVFYIAAAIGLNYTVRPSIAASDETTAQTPETGPETTPVPAPNLGVTPETAPGSTPPTATPPASEPPATEPEQTPPAAGSGDQPATPSSEPTTPPVFPSTPPAASPSTPG